MENEKDINTVEKTAGQTAADGKNKSPVANAAQSEKSEGQSGQGTVQAEQISAQAAQGDEKKKEKTPAEPPVDPMIEGGLFKKLIFYTIPIVLTGILQLLFNSADLIMVGNFCGSLSVAAVGATGALINLLVNLFIGLSVGAGVAVAHALGAKKSKTVFETVHTAIPTAFRRSIWKYTSAE
mgnify:FL=1